jgi:hypothetical protein
MAERHDADRRTDEAPGNASSERRLGMASFTVLSPGPRLAGTRSRDKERFSEIEAIDRREIQKLATAVSPDRVSNRLGSRPAFFVDNRANRQQRSDPQDRR